MFTPPAIGQRAELGGLVVPQALISLQRAQILVQIPWGRFGSRHSYSTARRRCRVPHELSEDFAKLRPNVHLRLVDSDQELLSAMDEIWAASRRFLMDGAG